jgi:hypothetical protein
MVLGLLQCRHAVWLALGRLMPIGERKRYIVHSNELPSASLELEQDGTVIGRVTRSAQPSKVSALLIRSKTPRWSCDTNGNLLAFRRRGLFSVLWIARSDPSRTAATERKAVINSLHSREADWRGRMPKFKHYSPQLSREVVSRLYHRAKAERMPMTKLVNRIIEQALKNKKQINRQRITANQHTIEPN